MMTRYEPAWIYNFVLKIAVAIFLGTLAIGLAVGVAPLTALMRSGAGFGVFAMLAWAAAVTWDMPKPPEPPQAETEEDQAETEAKAQPQSESAQNGTSKSQNGSAQQQFTPLSPASVENIPTGDDAGQPELATAGVIKEPAEAMS